MFRWLITAEALDKDDNPVNLLFSDGKFIREGKVYLPRISQPGLYRFGMFAGSVVSTQRSGYGETSLINNDGGLEYLADYAIDGRSVILERVNNDKSITKVFSGTALGFKFSGNEVIIRLRDPSESISESHPHETYAGDNVLPEGLEGTEEDLKGVVKPQVFGRVKNASPSNVNTAKLIFQVSSRDDCNISAVYDNGTSIDLQEEVSSIEELQELEPEPSKYTRFKGFFRLGSPAYGEITCDAETHSCSAGDVLKSICDDVGIDLDSESVNRLNDVGSVGYYLDSSENTTNLIDQLCESIGALFSMFEEGRAEAKILEPPELLESKATIREHMISEASRSAIGSGDNGLPIWKVELGVDRIFTVQTSVAGDVPRSRASRLKREYRTASAVSDTAKERHKLSSSYYYDSWVSRMSDGNAICDRLLAMYSVRRDRVSVEVPVSRSTDLGVGEAVDLIYPRFGYSDPRRMLVLGVELDASDKVQILDLWG